MSATDFTQAPPRPAAPLRRTIGGFVGALSLALASALAAQTGATGVGSQFELVFWQSVASSEDIGQYEAYLSRYPEGTFAALARAKIERLRPAAPARVPTGQPAVPQPGNPSSAIAVAAPAAVPPRIDGPAAPTVTAPRAEPVNAPASPMTTQATTAEIAAPVPAPPPVPMPATAQSAPAPATAPGPASELSLAQQLAALAQSQGRATTSPAVASGQGGPVPPVLRVPDPVVLPPHFCSAVERNAFYDEHFTPSKDVADDNNRLAIAHLQTLQRLYDELGQRGDPDGQNAIAAQSKAYQSIAAAAYQASAGYEQLFQNMMAVPIANCAAVPPKPGKP